MPRSLAPLRQGLALATLVLATHVFSVSAHGGRRLLASAFCCRDGYCQQAATGGGLQCAYCAKGLLLGSVENSGLCVCVPGKYGTVEECVDCPKGEYCPGGVWRDTGPNTPARQDCPQNMTTLGVRSTSVDACVNLPGTYYNIESSSGRVSVWATDCPVDTYSPGLKKQRSCVPCPTGFITAGETAQSNPKACVVPAGYFLKAPGQVAPCPPGEWKADLGSAANCTKCPNGVTTVKEASTSLADCKVLRIPFYAAAIAADGTITEARVCPQNYLCPGGIPESAFDPQQPAALSASEKTIKRCPNGLWTQDPGAYYVKQCQTPPGFFTAINVTQKCPPASYRAEWKPAGSEQAASCTSCGMGVLAEASDRLTVFDPVTYQPSYIATTTGDYDCYIQPGQGLYYLTTLNTWRAVNCDKNNYGTTNITYGLTPAPCRECPANMLAENSDAYPASKRFFRRNADGTGGFTDPAACVTLPGFGYRGRVAQRCDQGTFNSGGNQAQCQSCPQGTTTLAPGVGKTEADCWIAPGYGPNGPCPIGTYNDRIRQDRTTQCDRCPLRTTTEAPGSDSPAQCQFCLPGFGGPGCSSVCGGLGTAASYGPPGRSLGSSCVSCGSNGVTYGYSFDWQMGNDVFAPRTISRTGATSSIDCVSEYAQLVDMSWYLPLASSVSTAVTANVSTFQACVDLCTGACEFVTYDYVARTCTVRNGAEVIFVGEPYVGFKVLVSGYTGTNPWGAADTAQQAAPSADSNTAAKGVPSGLYTFWQDPNAFDIGVQYAPPDAANFQTVQQCLDACSDDRLCAGITIDETVDRTKVATTCKLIKGDDSNGQFKRTVVRTDLDRIGLPVFYLCLGARTSSNDLTGCSPITTLDQVVFVLKKRTQCDAAFIAAAREQATAYLTTPTPTSPTQAAPIFSLRGACVDAALLAELNAGRLV